MEAFLILAKLLKRKSFESPLQSPTTLSSWKKKLVCFKKRKETKHQNRSFVLFLVSVATLVNDFLGIYKSIF